MIRLLLALLIVCGLAFAQPPRGFFPWWDRPVAKDLNLTPDQMRRIRQTVREYRNKLVDLRAGVEKAELDLQDVFEDEHIDPKKAGAAVEGLAQARGNLTRAFSQMSLDLRVVLTQQQWKELQKRREEIETERKAKKAADKAVAPK
jgi:Spy/CpxP family protein refolding chaperone